MTVRTAFPVWAYAGLALSLASSPGCSDGGDDDASIPAFSPTPGETATPTGPTPSATPAETDTPVDQTSQPDSATPGSTPDVTDTPASTPSDETDTPGSTPTAEPSIPPPSPTPEDTPVPTATPTEPPGPTETPAATDADADGFTTLQDCDDADPTVHPGALEHCNGRDDDCDSRIDEDTGAWFPDRDHDGFGEGLDPASKCSTGTPWVQTRGDCNDGNAAIHPGAADASGDSVDQDCGGSAGPEPHVGFSGSKATIKEAIDAASADGISVWVGPGTYLESGLTPDGRAITLISTHFAAKTTIDADGKGRVMVFYSGETASTVVDGFTLTGGYLEDNDGAGLRIDASSPTIANCVITGNVAGRNDNEDSGSSGGDGGGVYLSQSNARLEGCTISGNRAVGDLYITMINPGQYVPLWGGGYGGGVYVNGGAPRLERCSISGNDAWFNGGGIYTLDTTAAVEDSVIAGNLASNGGGIYFEKGSPAVLGSVVASNSAKYGGGGIYFYSAPAALQRVILSADSADRGGALFVSGSSPALDHLTAVGNRASDGGGIFITGASAKPSLLNSIVAFNSGYNLYNDPEAPGAPLVTYSDLFVDGGDNHNLSKLGTTNLTVDPKLVRYDGDSDGLDDDFHLLPGAPTRNAADPATTDPDGSRADMGAFGGTGADMSWYADVDQDGLYDGWEDSQGLDATVADADADPDADGATNAQELEAGLYPLWPDFDGDGDLDGAELAAGVDPADWYAQPGVTGAATAVLPGDFLTIQAAIDAVRDEGRIDLEPGTWHESLRIADRKVALTGVDGAVTTVLEAAGDTGLTALRATLELRGLTITGATAEGRGLSLTDVAGELADLIVSGNLGGGMRLVDSSPTLRHCVFRDNQATEDDSPGGGLSLETSSPVLVHCSFANNGAALGGGIYIEDSSPSINQCVLAGNWLTGGSTEGGGGIFVMGSASRPKITNTISAYNAGYNLYNDDSDPGTITLSYSDLYSTSGQPNHNLARLGQTNKDLEPGFLAYGSNGMPTDLHLSKSSSLVNLGDTALSDADKSRSDMGIYGGAEGDDWDRDGDGWTDWFWPGSINEPPSGFKASDYDSSDLDPLKH